MTLSLDRINKAREAGYDDDTIIDAIHKRDPEFGQRIQKAKDAGYDSKTIMQSIEQRLSTSPQTTPTQNQPTPVSPFVHTIDTEQTSARIKVICNLVLLSI